LFVTFGSRSERVGDYTNRCINYDERNVHIWDSPRGPTNFCIMRELLAYLSLAAKKLLRCSKEGQKEGGV
jgi:hypothetical protein